MLLSDLKIEGGRAVVTHDSSKEEPPYTGDIEADTLDNNYFRKVLFTGKHSQLVVMSLRPGEDIGDEVHKGVDQFFRIESGQAKFILNETEEYIAAEGQACVVPCGTFHNVINMSDADPLKLYTIYSPSNHPPGTIHETKADAIAGEKEGE